MKWCEGHNVSADRLGDMYILAGERGQSNRSFCIICCSRGVRQKCPPGLPLLRFLLREGAWILSVFLTHLGEGQ